MPDDVSATTVALMLGCFAASLTVLCALVAKRSRGRQLLPYEPRRSVPWGPATAAVALFFCLSAVFGSLLAAGKVPTQDSAAEQQVVVPEEVPQQPENVPLIEEVPTDTKDTAIEEGPTISPVLNSLTMTAFLLALTWLVLTALRLGSHADARDLGLPLSMDQLFQDIGIGAVACLASFIPIYAIQIGLTLYLRPEVEHPLIEQLKDSNTPEVFWASVLLAVVAAPISEEIFFRLILQGWLEKWEDTLLGFTGLARGVADEAPVFPGEYNGLALQEEATKEAILETMVRESTLPEESRQDLPPRFELRLPAKGAIPALPHGWLPILTSGTLFGLAHLGQGVAPVALVFFGIVLGYVYQRTHRIVPTMTAHALFNGYSMLMLWLQLP